MDIVKGVFDREALANTSLGKGVACPHIRVRQEGELLCAVGWSPTGIDYDARDGNKVHLVIMYYVPDSQRNAYLKEVSGFAKALQKSNGIQIFEDITDIHTIRNKLLDWIDVSISDAVPDAKARMIRLGAMQATIAEPQSAATTTVVKALPYEIIPFTLVVLEGGVSKVLAQNPDVIHALETEDTMRAIVNHHENTPIDISGYSVNVTNVNSFSSGRMLIQCVAIRFTVS